ncbi:unnamed protein product [Sphagnum balticum]
MYSNAKAVALLRDVSDKLSKRLAFNGVSVNSVSTAFSAPDAAGGVWPYLLISQNGNVAEGQPVIYVKISAQDMVSRDIFGNDTDSYAPHNLLVAYELSGAAGSNPIANHADIATVLWETIKTGVRLNLAELANGNAVTDANASAATPILSIDELYWPTKGV